MRKLAFLLMVPMMIVAVGCKKTESTTKKSTNTKSTKLDIGALEDVTITQGGKSTLKVTITRTEMPDAVNVELKGLPKGVKADKATIGKDGNEATFEIRADAKAEVGESKATVVAKGGEVSKEKEFKIEVKKASKAKDE